VSQGAQVAIRYAWYQQVTIYRLAVTAEVAGSSPVVPATKSRNYMDLWHSDKSRGTSKVLTRVLEILAPFFVLGFPFHEGVAVEESWSSRTSRAA
jgi:hypothetical protein